MKSTSCIPVSLLTLVVACAASGCGGDSGGNHGPSSGATGGAGLGENTARGGAIGATSNAQGGNSNLGNTKTSGVAPSGGNTGTGIATTTDTSFGGINSTGGTSSTGGSNEPGGTSSTGGASNVSVTIEESDPAFCGALGTVATDHAGYTGSGYLDSQNFKGVGISWVVNVPVTGTYTLSFRFANGGTAAHTTRLRIAHQDGELVDFAANSNWDIWQDKVVTVTLPAGHNHLSLLSLAADGLPNVDSLTVTGVGVTAVACSSYAPSSTVSFASPKFTNVSVHDPSVIKSGSTYYVFGSHLGAAKTTDLMNWTLVADQGVTTNNPLFNNVLTELSEAFAWSNVQGLWAPDVLQLKSTNKFLMYYNSCEGSSPRSAMGIATASNVEGPYADSGLFLYSGMWGVASPDGTVYNPLGHPNAIDPNTFYDKNGNLWMVYGSYSGGIFILQLNTATGLPLANQGYGTHLLGGNHAPIEGPYIQYSADTGFYYLFTSYGGLGYESGYNMRVARSTNPNGPYYDARGVDQSTVKADATVPLFDTVTIAPNGVKIVGNHVWANTNGSFGYVSAGHNSTYYDASTGSYYLIFHTRFPGAGEYHEVRVHQMYMNVDGWPVVAPLRYAPRTNASGMSAAKIEYVGLGEVPGTYQVVNHGKDISATIKESVAVTLATNGTLTGAKTGTWKYGGNNVLVVDVDGTSFRGVLSRQWNENAGGFRVTFSGLDATGIALWGIRTGS